MAVSPPHLWALKDTMRVWPLVRGSVAGGDANFVDWCVATMASPGGHVSIGWWGLQHWMEIVNLSAEKMGIFLFEAPPPIGRGPPRS